MNLILIIVQIRPIDMAVNSTRREVRVDMILVGKDWQTDAWAEERIKQR